MVKRYKNLRSAYISISLVDALRTITILFYKVYHFHKAYHSKTI